MDDLCEGLVHLALASPADFCRSNVEFRQFISDPVQLIAPLDHPWAQRDEIEVEELLEADFILREVGSGTYEVASQALEAAGLAMDQLRTVLTLGNSEAIALAVEEGLGVGFVSHIVTSRLVSGRVATVKVRGLDMHQDIYIGRNVGLPATTAQNAFWEFVTDPHNPVLLDLADHGFKNLLPAVETAAAIPRP